MKDVLMIAYQFPPMGGSGVQRSVKFVKHLRTFGYNPVVYTRNIENIQLLDKTLLKDIPENTRIIRSSAYDVSEWKSVFKLPGKALGKIMIPDTARIWAESSKKKLCTIIEASKIKLIYTTSAPYSDHLIGLYLKRKYPDIVWAADFRDEWTNNPYTLDNPYNPLRTNIEKNMENSVLKNADILITNTPIMRKNFVENNNLKGDNFFVIPNGYDKEDFDELDLTKSSNSKFTLVYTGALYGRRKPDTFFEALKQLISENKIDSNKITVRLIGNYHNDKLQSKIDSYGLKDIIEIVGYLPHDECVKQQLLADSLVLIEGTGRGADAFYTGKLFEYMNTGRPVLAIIPENGAAADLIRKSRIGNVSHTDNVDSIKDNILQYYNDWFNGVLDFNPDREFIERFERKELTKQLAELFDRYC